MTKRLAPDICVIGGGAGGRAVAMAAAAFGVPVALVEKEEMGGDGPNQGDAPVSALVAAARQAHAMRHGARLGLGDAWPQVNFGRLHRHIRAAVEASAPNRTAERLGALGILVLREEARFHDRRTVVAGAHEIRARRFVVATGSTPVIPAVPGLESVDVLTPDTIAGLSRRPGKLVVIGGGSAGLAIAQAHRRLGVEVTVVELNAALADEDAEAAALVLGRLRAEGVDIRERAKATRVERRGKAGFRLHVEGGSGDAEAIDGTHLLVAAGRRPAVDGLDLEKAGVAFSPAGIAVDDRLRTANRRVHAIGDVTGGPRSAHAAEHHAGLVVRAILFRERARANALAIPRLVLTDPQIAQVGLSEAEARATHRAIRVLRWPYAENEAAQARRETAGFVKLIADPKERILGVSIVGAEAGEAVGAWALALSKELSVGDMAAFTPPSPTLGEIGKRAAIAYFAGEARKPKPRRLVRLLRLLG